MQHLWSHWSPCCSVASLVMRKPRWHHQAQHLPSASSALSRERAVMRTHTGETSSNVSLAAVVNHRCEEHLSSERPHGCHDGGLVDQQGWQGQFSVSETTLRQLLLIVSFWENHPCKKEAVKMRSGFFGYKLCKQETKLHGGCLELTLQASPRSA